MSAWPTGPYGVIYVDPPWRYNFSRSKSRKIENQYPTMSIAEIKALAVDDGKGGTVLPIAADDSVLFLWATAPKLPEAFDVMSAWGFTYKTNMVWDKELIGMGYYWRGRHEHLLLGTRGKPGVPHSSVRPPSVLRQARRRHSAKPELVHWHIYGMYPDARRIELFARKRVPGWDAWGNEV